MDYGNRQRSNRDLKQKIFLIIILTVIGVTGFIGYKLFWDKIFNKAEKPLSEYAVEKYYKDKEGNILETYSYIEVKEKKVNLENIKEWCVEYATPNIDKYDKLIIKYKGDSGDRGIILSLENYVTVDCKIVEERSGYIQYQHQGPEYHLLFDGDKITKYTYDKNNGTKSFIWDPKTKDWIETVHYQEQ